uniref:Leucine-rich repeat-containing N-terminal plant-type domain-containing protein n=1 Tax=Nelumbo nucifera TaxID=4432 RepID=A0A822XKM5_NELNU|nr:TPA_asm: hypothetical protein HUJ06_022025 [Nelumbo nucifera]
MHKLRMIGLLLLLWSSMFSICMCCCRDHKEALLRFKSSLIRVSSNSNDEILFDLESWNSNSDCCQWERITCDESSIRSSSPSKPVVIGLDLSNLYINTFSLLMPIFNISTLTKLDVSRNFLHGEIPVSQLSNLSRLTYLDMSYNNLDGSIPCQLFTLRNLQHLDLSGNSFHGEFLSGNLKFLNLAGNFLSGKFQSETADRFTKLLKRRFNNK